jgi:hypothetical protein
MKEALKKKPSLAKRSIDEIMNSISGFGESIIRKSR